MNPKGRPVGRRSTERLRYFLIMALGVTVACEVDRPPVPYPPPPPKQAAALYSRLRVRNVGSFPIRELIVMFPTDQLRFGDVEGGATTRYLDVPKGVYRYAALRHSWQGRPVTEPVDDWLGETPFPVGSFTYQLRAEPYGDAGVVFLLDVLRER